MDNEKGQSLVELAISFIFIMFLLAGVAELGITFFQQIQLRDAAQEGALYGSICQDVSQIEARVRGASFSPIDLSNPDVVIIVQFENPSGVVIPISAVRPEDGVRVQVFYSHNVFMPIADRIFGKSILLRGEVVDTVLSVNTSC